MEKKNISRRNFLGTSLAAVASVTATNSLGSENVLKQVPAKKNDEHPFNERTYNAMPTRSFGKTGYKVGILSLGGQATIEMKGTETESEKIINRAIDLGVNYIDTAASYGGGISQLNIGRVMKTRRSEVWLSSKTHDRKFDGSMRLLEESLKNLQTDHLDTWQLHNVQTMAQLDQIFSADGAIKAMEKAKAEGMIRAKTGTVNGVKSFAGYANTISGKKLIFAIIVNNFTCRTKVLKKKLENVMVKMAEYD